MYGSFGNGPMKKVIKRTTKRSVNKGGRSRRRSIASRINELASAGTFTSMSKQQKDTTKLVKTCVQAVRTKGVFMDTLRTLWANDSCNKDCGARWLAEYVAHRAGLQVRDMQFLNKSNPIWVTSTNTSTSKVAQYNWLL